MFFSLTALLLAAQDPLQTPIRTTVPLVLAPVSVTGRDAKPVAGLTSQDFEVLDGGKPRAHQLEVESQPVAVVVAIQTNSRAGPALAKIVKTGSMFLPLVAGEGGAVAVLSYSDHVRVHQDFTSKAEWLVSSFRSLRPEGEGARLLDAAGHGLEMLAGRNPIERRVLIMIGESRDRSSESKLADVLAKAVASNVTIYTVSFSVYLTSFTSRGSERFGETEKEKEKGTPVFQAGGMSLLAAFDEIVRLGKANAAEAMAQATGGVRLSFARLKGLEQVVARISEDLYNQYLISFSPAGAAEGFHSIRVVVKSRPDLLVRTRPGYSLSP